MSALLSAFRDNGLEATAVAFGIVSVYLSVRQKIWSWPTAIVNVLFYFLVFRQAKLYAQMWLQLVYFVLSVYGWYEWLYGGAHRSVLKVSRTTPLLSFVLLGLAGAAAGGLGIYFERHTDAALPYMDSALVGASLAAQWMMTRKVLENWIVWMVADVVYVGMFIYTALYLTAGLYAVFLALAAMGWAQWKRSYEADRSSRTGVAVPA